jgi:hypothetical protein
MSKRKKSNNAKFHPTSIAELKAIFENPLPVVPIEQLFDLPKQRPLTPEEEAEIYRILEGIKD